MSTRLLVAVAISPAGVAEATVVAGAVAAAEFVGAGCSCRCARVDPVVPHAVASSATKATVASRPRGAVLGRNSLGRRLGVCAARLDDSAAVASMTMSRAALFMAARDSDQPVNAGVPGTGLAGGAV